MIEQVQQVPMELPLSNTTPLTPEEAAKGRDTVHCVFEQPVRLNVAWGQLVHYPIGIHPVPTQWKDHWFLKAHGVRVIGQQVAVGDVDGKSKKK